MKEEKPNKKTRTSGCSGEEVKEEKEREDCN
jgi:hypothetical protein